MEKALHPGIVLRQKYLLPMGISPQILSTSLQIPVSRIQEILQGKRSIELDTAIKLSRFFGTKPQMWMELQKAYDQSL